MSVSLRERERERGKKKKNFAMPGLLVIVSRSGWKPPHVSNQIVLDTEHWKNRCMLVSGSYIWAHPPNWHFDPTYMLIEFTDCKEVWELSLSLNRMDDFIDSEWKE